MAAEIYWIEAGSRGRLAIVGRPRSGDWLADEISAWRAAGLTDVVSLLEDHEVCELDLVQEPKFSERVGLSFQRFPIPDRVCPPLSMRRAAYGTLWWGKLGMGIA
jgi:hypothetical protein